MKFVWRSNRRNISCSSHNNNIIRVIQRNFQNKFIISKKDENY